MSNDILNQILLSLGDIKQQQGSNTATITAILEQSKKTNGRVTELEKVVTSQSKIQLEQHNLVSRLNQDTLANNQRMEERIKDNEEFAKREINEFKKIRKEDVDLEVEKVKSNSGFKIALVTGIISTVTTLIITFFSK